MGSLKCEKCGHETRLPEVAMPDGWQLVPIKPTAAMIEAALHCLDRVNLTTAAAKGNAMTATKADIQLYKVCNRWWAMIAARPSVPSPLVAYPCRKAVGGYCEKCDSWVQPGVCGDDMNSRGK